jgi:hypothetical protein
MINKPRINNARFCGSRFFLKHTRPGYFSILYYPFDLKMRLSLCTVLVLLVTTAFGQPDIVVRQTLSSRLGKIRTQEYYDSSPVTYDDTTQRLDLSFPYWVPDVMYYQYDLVRYQYRRYEALRDSIVGQRPDTARVSWALSDGPHPYLFLRDTAQSEDLLRLMTDEHPYVRVYAFGALAHRNADGLFSLIRDNLDDTTLLTVSGCAFSQAYPADLMIEYSATKLTRKERSELIRLISRRYRHLTLGMHALREKQLEFSKEVR